ncbi:polysaccharide deacetylase family protein [Dehalobacterium formicoaceticum]|uniref:Polysaccharide deacetylase family protein n=1 Tax=Dehalobacterium formicoaceticum TaxID=51515 RepID=A0ABT1Y324_9FIRM|nr:polysaccharide deacetylase family protein [Dehalobacterium formicoaceticum]MCR6545272.1 polysaccharide deacetylase family protein [Dehalobacterium formicoaceticum]
MIVIDMRGKRKYKWLAGTILLVMMAGVVLAPAQLTGRNYLVSMVSKTIRLLPIYSVDVPDKRIAISFDATWGIENTEKLLTIMEEHKIKTTFFLVNIWLEKYPDVARTIASKGHEIGMHSATHPHFTQLSEAQMEKELQDNFQMIYDATEQKPVLFRPPYGDYNNNVIRTVDRLGFKAIQWSVDSLDWKDLSANEIQDRILTKIKPGDIILFHNAGKYTPDALDPMLTALEKDGYQVVPISELLLTGDTYIDYAGIQRKK